MIYGFFAATLAPLFFPSNDPTLTTLLGLSTFAMGFVARPIGSLVFGHIGDRLGRKQALVLSIFLVTIPTFIIGALPTYDQIGVAAPIILITCRLLQGFCLGGELGGAITYIIENSHEDKKGLTSSLLAMSTYIGAVSGTLIGLFSTLTFMPNWGWRVPFLMGALFGCIGLYFRTRIDESPAFKSIKKEPHEQSLPIINTLKHNKLSMIKTMGICMGFTVPFYLITTYTNEIYKTNLGLETWEIMRINSALMILWITALPFTGYLADLIGIRKILLLCSASLAITAYPLFTYAMSDVSVSKVILMQLGLSLFAIGFSGPFSSIFVDLFPSRKRYTGIGFSYALGAMLFGGFTPLFAYNLTRWTGNPASPALLIVISGLVSFIAVLSLKSRQSIMTEDYRGEHECA